MVWYMFQFLLFQISAYFPRSVLLKLLVTINLISFFDGVLFLHFKNTSTRISTYRWYLKSLFYSITWNVLKFIWVSSWFITVRVDAKTNPVSSNKLFFKNGYNYLSLKFKQHINAYVYECFTVISILFCL